MAVALIIVSVAFIAGCAENVVSGNTDAVETTKYTETAKSVTESTAVTETTVPKTETKLETTATTKETRSIYDTTPVTRIDMTVYVPQTEETKTTHVKYTMNPPPKREFPELPEVPSEPDINMTVNVTEGSGGGSSGYLFSIGKINSINADGTMTVTLAGNKIENAEKLNWVFIYLDFDGNLCRAGSSTSVSLKSTEDIVKPVKEAIQDYKKAYDEYNKTVEYGMSDTVKAEYYAAAEEAYQAYEAAKDKAVGDSLDGRFWGVENSPVYKYINSYKYSYQKEPEDVTFYFILKDGEYCVLVNTFFKA